MAATPMYTVRYSRDEKFFYVNCFDFGMARHWCAVVPGEMDEKYEVLPFAFYDLKAGREEELPEDHELVKRYFALEHWPTRGTPEWNAALLATIRYHEGELSRAQIAVDRNRAAITSLSSKLEPA